MKVDYSIVDIETTSLNDGVVISLFGDGITISLLLDEKQSKILVSEILSKSTKTDHPTPPTIPKEGQ